MRSRHGGRGPDPARGHGRAGQPRRLHQARAALDLSRAAARRQGPLRHGDARGGFRRPPVRRLDPRSRCSISPRRARSTRKRSGGCRSSAPQARGKALVNLLPIEPGERITTIMPLPEDEASWESLDVMFATTRGTVRRNKLSDFAAGQSRRQDRDEARRGREHRRRADLLGQGRRAADDGEGPVHPLRGRRRARVQGPRFDGRARRRARRGRQRDLAGDSRAVRRGERRARRLSEDAPRRWRGETGEEPNGGEAEARAKRDQRRRRAVARALRADVGGRADRS